MTGDGLLLAASVVIAGIAIAAAIVVVLRRRTQPEAKTEPVAGRANESSSAGSDVAVIDKHLYDFAKLNEEAEEKNLVPVAVQFLDDRALESSGTVEALAFGDAVAINHMGTSVSEVPRELVQIAVGSGTAVRAIHGYGEASGRLVMLSKETARVMRNNPPMRGPSGYVRGVFLDKSGKIVHLAQIRSANALLLAGHSTQLIGGLAAQAQMARIEATLARIEGKIGDVLTEMDLELTSRTDSALDTIRSVYAESQVTGFVTQKSWDRLANTEQALGETVKHWLGRVRNDTKKGNEVTSAVSNRLERERELAQQAPEDLAHLQEAVRGLVQWEVLRIWHLTSTQDPGLEAALDQLPARLRPLGEAEQAAQALQDAVGHLPDVHRVRRVVRWRKAPKLTRGAAELESALESMYGGEVAVTDLVTALQRQLVGLRAADSSRPALGPGGEQR